MGMLNNLAHAWSVFTNKDPTPGKVSNGSTSRPHAKRMAFVSEKTIIGSLYNKISIEVSNYSLLHIRKDEEDNFESVINGTLQYTLNMSPNIDQTRRAFIQDLVLSLIDEGVVAVVPTTTNYDPFKSDSYEITSLRVGSIVEWAPKDVRVLLYNDDTGHRESVWLPKKFTAIVENPHYSVMNDSNSTLKRLVRKLNLLDAIDEQSGSGKLDIIVQLPYVVKSPTRKATAETRVKDIEVQLTNSKYGIAYVDGTEKITQLNRPAENNLMAQIEYLIDQLYSQIGVSPEVFAGTADEVAMLNFQNTTIEPILDAIASEFTRKFLTKTAITQKQAISYFKDPFKLVPISQIAEIADTMTRNEVLSSNEIRAVVGRRPSKEPGANELRNKNLNEKVPTNEPVIKKEDPNAKTKEV
jgi:hypothetical protein